MTVFCVRYEVGLKNLLGIQHNPEPDGSTALNQIKIWFALKIKKKKKKLTEKRAVEQRVFIFAALHIAGIWLILH